MTRLEACRQRSIERSWGQLLRLRCAHYWSISGLKSSLRYIGWNGVGGMLQGPAISIDVRHCGGRRRDTYKVQGSDI